MIGNRTQTTLTRQADDKLDIPVPARITKVESLTALEKVFTLELPAGISLGHRPGQFVEVSVYGIGEAPISISSSPSRSNGSFELCVRKVGDVTGALHKLEPGASIGVRGPFGRGFPIEKFRGDDTWKGNVGVITTLFRFISIHPRNTIAITCGPPVMYRFVLMELLGKNISEGNIYLSLERRMKCGVGKCGHCQINNVYACQSGPVFPYNEIKGLEEAL
jgi:NAD(P)H-flavin reductase